MNLSEEAVQEYIEKLEKDATQIENNLKRFFKEVKRRPKRTRPSDPVSAAAAAQRGGGSTSYKWKTPEGTTKQLQRDIRQDYEDWYSRAEELVVEYRPRQIEKFQSVRGRIEDRVLLDWSASKDPSHHLNDCIDHFDDQRNIVKAIPSKIDARKLEVRRAVSKDEVQRARSLLEEGLTRASGVVAGVALERHLISMCEETNEDLDFHHDDGIASLAQTLYEADEITQTTLSSLKTLGSIRNDCAHANEQEPNEHKVQKLIDDTDDYIRGRGI